MGKIMGDERVIVFPGCAEPESPDQPVESVIKNLKVALELAERGELRSVVIIALDGTDTLNYFESIGDYKQLRLTIAGLAVQQAYFCNQMVGAQQFLTDEDEDIKDPE